MNIQTTTKHEISVYGNNKRLGTITHFELDGDVSPYKVIVSQERGLPNLLLGHYEDYQKAQDALIKTWKELNA